MSKFGGFFGRKAGLFDATSEPAPPATANISAIRLDELPDNPLELDEELFSTLGAQIGGDNESLRNLMLDANAKRFDHLTYLDILKQSLKVMDSTAISMCMDHNLPVLVFNLRKVGNIKRAVLGEQIGTLVSES